MDKSTDNTRKIETRKFFDDKNNFWQRKLLDGGTEYLNKNNFNSDGTRITGCSSI